ncbi:site-specific integrase [Bradyrhizobium sp. CIR3A]|uniref:tyrosine-type recombinase/integrase n=1 Tax=Bradyrhizobium sp. CIR3A TaxID=2663838 RepID=UPI0016056974|nr:site-specific integrase [Bradyrhizobium sp. CIR3A]MBB4262676.1 integrase [Bradyrhizobium sp. CIR3A]
MVRVDLKGVAKVKAKGHTYYYAWRGGPRLRGLPGSPEFIASYNEAIEQRRAPDEGRVRFVVADYKKRELKKLSPSTRAEWGKWLDRISTRFGDLRIAQFDRPDKIRPSIRRWRDEWSDTPRTADYGLQVLSRVCSHAIDPLGKIAVNPCEGIKRLYSNDRSEIIWTDADIQQIKKTCSPEIAAAVDLAAHTGLRLGDLVRVSWSHIGEDAILLTTGKSRHRREALVPLYDALREVLERIPKRATTILSSSRKRPWTVDGFGSSFNKAKIDAGLADRDLHFNDLRGTAATKFYIAGFTEREIAETLAWEEASVAKIIRRYVGRTAAIKAKIAKLKETKR